MERIYDLTELRACVAHWRYAGDSIAFVPTMGNLHAGHLTLVAEGRSRARHLVVSIFVNPLQFGPQEDLAAYPRTLEQDAALLDKAGCDLLFAPDLGTMYPRARDAHTRVEVPGLSGILCGASRPGHFTGVATVVCKLFHMVQPDLALFGEKDFQQLLVIRRLVEDLAMPIEVVAVPTVREPDGLAMSSRNGYLSAEERARAPALYRTLQIAADALRTGRPAAKVEREASETLARAGLRPDYISVRRGLDLAEPGEADRDLVILAAVYLGRARLIDNLRLQR